MDSVGRFESLCGRLVRRHLPSRHEGEVPGQLGAGTVVDSDTGRPDVLGQMLAGPGAGDEKDIGCEVEQPRERDLRRSGPEAGAEDEEDGTREDRVLAPA